MAETVYVGRGQDVRGMPGLEYKRPDYTVSPEPKSVVLILKQWKFVMTQFEGFFFREAWWWAQWRESRVHYKASGSFLEETMRTEEGNFRNPELDPIVHMKNSEAETCTSSKQLGGCCGLEPFRNCNCLYKA